MIADIIPLGVMKRIKSSLNILIDWVYTSKGFVNKLHKKAGLVLKELVPSLPRKARHYFIQGEME
jgi:hypothetical protein